MSRSRRPRLGFAGVGWIGLNRMQAVIESAVADVAAIVDTQADCVARAREYAPEAQCCGKLESLLELGLDGVVIATPSAMHAEHAALFLRHGVPVFCQKPLGRNALETAQVIALANEHDRLLGVDLSYRHTTALRRVREMIQSGAIGRVFAAELKFHNAYGPDKPWFYSRSLSGGGCLIDLGIHLIDAALWVLDFPAIESVDARVYWRGQREPTSPDEVEDYATARLDLSGGVLAQLQCSWRLPLGQDAEIGLRFFGDRGGVGMRNVQGSFYDFVGERFEATRRTTLCAPPDAWGGRSIVAWAQRLAKSASFDPEIEHLARVAGALDAAYASANAPTSPAF